MDRNIAVEKETTYKTISRPSESLFKDRGSKFLGYAFPLNDPADAKKHIQELKAIHPKAVHYCYAYRTGAAGIHFRANDDGEPSGTAGKPILGQIDRVGITNVIIIVVRYFGGTLLGVPGLIHAYKTAAEAALSANEIIEKDIEHSLHLEFDYTIMNEVMLTLKQHHARILRQEQQLFCRMDAAVPLIHYPTCLQKLQEIHRLEIREEN